MIFNSFNFWVIFPFIFAILWLIPSRYSSAKKVYLIAISYLLYMNWKPVYALLLLFVTLVTYWGALIIERKQQIGTKSDRKKGLITVFALLTLFPLIVFKYYNFINESITAGLSHIGLHFSLPGLNWMIPIGISFFSFQAVGYLWDVYYGRIQAEHNWWNYMLFVSFFPQVTSGPISKASDLLPQLQNFKPFNYHQGVQGLKYLLWGMFLKVVIADRLGIYVDVVYKNYEHFSGINCLLASIMYSLQIYGDFAGYSLMAMGIAKTLGIDLINNFKRPYFATSITDFWKRWHISLTKWLTSYIYIPLGGSRCSKLRTYWNILITFLVSGIWHGDNWTFIIWGVLHGILQIIEKFFGLQKVTSQSLWVRIPRILLTFFLVNLAWIFFRMPTLQDAWGMIGHIFTAFNGSLLSQVGNSNLLFIVIGVSILFIKELSEEFALFKGKFFTNKGIRFATYVILFCMILCMGVLDSGQFIYANF